MPKSTDGFLSKLVHELTSTACSTAPDAIGTAIDSISIRLRENQRPTLVTFSGKSTIATVHKKLI